MIDFIKQHDSAIMIIMIVVLVLGYMILVTIQERRRAKNPLKYAALRVSVEGAESIPAGLDRDIRRGIGEDIPPQPGDRRWSNFFGSYVEMVHYSGDKTYWFTVLSGPHAGRTYKNQSPWSILPHSKPADYPRRKL